MNELSEICERNDFQLSLNYGDGDAVWDIEITDGDHIVYSSFVYKCNLPALISDAVEGAKKYITKKIQKDLFI